MLKFSPFVRNQEDGNLIHLWYLKGRTLGGEGMRVGPWLCKRRDEGLCRESTRREEEAHQTWLSLKFPAFRIMS
jgi:hypothetical protein